MRRSARCSPPGRARCSTWVVASGWSARPSAGRWWSVTAGASGRAATGHRRSPTPTTCGTGSTAAPPTWPTWRWSAGAITGWCTPAGAHRLGAGPPAGRNLERDAAVGGAIEPHRSRRRAEPRPVRGDPGAQHAQLLDELEHRRLADLEVAPERGQPDRPTTLETLCGGW